ncbi:ABC transporter substrate-binding protein [Ruminococcus sp.]|uniref:ABC transporter substrate-binding protein n=2 Tax=Ruminococcus sp. TaxID=41978 RepID=UPI002BD06663|nr:ABC transporter substrate-binding protein [Ruminococcus sp.]HNZ98732.1 ABC transporter substrate-binding protein [Ruminococcus sp.]
MKKFIFKAAALCCALSLSACTSKKAVSVTPPDGSLDKCELRFSWWGGDDRHEATLKTIDLWSKKHPDITITPEYGGWDGWTEKVTAQMKGGTEPDIMQINYDWLITMSPDGKGFYDLDSLSGTLDLSGFDEDTLSFGRADGKLNAVTVSLSGRGLFYNSEAYSAIGADYPRTWSDLIALGESFGSHDAYPLDLDIQSGGTAWYLAVVYIQQKTGRQFITLDGELGFTQEDIRDALDFYKLLEDNHVIRTVKTRTDEDGNAALYQSSEFIGEKVAGVLEWGSAVGKYEAVLPKGVLEAGPLLAGENGNNSGWMIKPSLLYAVSGHTKYPDEAAAFMDLLLNDEECAKILGTTRGIPASRKASSALEKSGALTGLSKESQDILNETDTITISPYMELSRMKSFYNTAIESVSYGTADTEAAAEQMYRSVTEYLEKIKNEDPNLP